VNHASSEVEDTGVGEVVMKGGDRACGRPRNAAQMWICALVLLLGAGVRADDVDPFMGDGRGTG
jgi:hypothetical protein